MKKGSRINKILLTLTVIVAGVLMGRGETVSQKQAQQLAQLFFNEAAGRVTPPPKLVYNGRKLTTARLFTPFYVYNSSTGAFVIISAENKAMPILGFSLKDTFDPDRLGDTETALLRSYAIEIELVRYDTQPIDETVRAWQDYPSYVEEILKSKYLATDPKFSVEEGDRIINEAIERDNAIYSDIYTPGQWKEMILDELRVKECAVIAIVGKDSLLPAIVYGHQGEYFRIEMSRRNDWLMRLNATEVIPSDMVSVVVNPLEIPYDMEEEIPFAEHDAFLAEAHEEEERRMSKSSIDFIESDGEPVVKALGSGHFEITLPENGIIANIYNIAGTMVRRFTYSDTPVINIDISSNPNGFYFILIEGESGRPYGLKLYK